MQNFGTFCGLIALASCIDGFLKGGIVGLGCVGLGVPSIDLGTDRQGVRSTTNPKIKGLL